MSDYYSLGLIGYPLEHSLSPRIHMAALQELDLAGEYRLYPVERPSGIATLLEEMRQGKIDGLNVTIPYKNDILALLDEITPAAREIGAVNTVCCQKRKLVGDNTDAKGFLADLDRLSWGKIGAPGNALVLGAGGSARAVVYALSRAGWRVAIAARRKEQSAALVKLIRKSIGEGSIIGQQVALSAMKLDHKCISSLNPMPSLIINTTPVGMYPQVDVSPWPAELDFPSPAAVYDLVYNPAETALMREARKMGLPVANGIGMLVEQAALSLEIWTGLPAPRQAMRQAVMEYSVAAS